MSENISNSARIVEFPHARARPSEDLYLVAKIKKVKPGEFLPMIELWMGFQKLGERFGPPTLTRLAAASAALSAARAVGIPYQLKPKGK